MRAVSARATRLLDERPFDHVVPGVADALRDLEAEAVEHDAQVGEHRRPAADHRAVGRRVQLRQADVAAELAVFDQRRQPALVVERLPRDGRVVDQLVANLLAEIVMLGQLLGDELAVRQLAADAHAVHEDHLLEAVVGVGVADDAHERREAGAGCEQEQVLRREQVGQHQRAGRLAADQHVVADLQVLQARGQRAVRYLDAEELEFFFVVRARDRIGTHQRLAVDHQADHHEVPALEAQARRARAGEGEERFVPVMDAGHALGVESRHVE